jgi:hypothetical protein
MVPTPPAIPNIVWEHKLCDVHIAYVLTEDGNGYELTWDAQCPDDIGWAEYSFKPNGQIAYWNSGSDSVYEILNVIGEIKDGNVRSKGLPTKN